ncbi:protein TonB-like [Homalodisca vitripennis]|uniref:protein TonB-like n=1 Tax=Homalodisca vitripennis TaxID=197043 RepID=UPI001EEBD5D1|nr:protein TonB-like [Homalodisca vitripennis]
MKSQSWKGLGKVGQGKWACSSCRRKEKTSQSQEDELVTQDIASKLDSLMDIIPSVEQIKNSLWFMTMFLILIVAIFFVGCSLQGPVPNAPKGTRMETRLAKTWMAMEHEMPKEEPETPEPETPEPETPEPETPEPETPEPETPEPETPPPESKEPKPYYSSA